MRILLLVGFIFLYTTITYAEKHDTPQALLQKYVNSIKTLDYLSFKKLQWYVKEESWVREKLQSSALTHPLLLAQTLKERERFTKTPSSSLAQKFKDTLHKFPPNIDWKTIKVAYQSECDLKSKWKCSIQAEVKSNTHKLKLLMRMMKFDQEYFLDQSIVLASSQVIKTINTNSAVERGKQLYKTLACVACHSVEKNQKRIGPSLYKFYGSTIESSKGEKQKVDDAHLKSSLMHPKKFVMKGYPPAMPSYQGRLDTEKLNDLITYLKTL